VLIKSHVLITFLFLVSLSAIQRRASDEPGKGSKDRSNVRAETREDGAHSPIWQARPSVQPPAGWSKLGGVWRKKGTKARVRYLLQFPDYNFPRYGNPWPSPAFFPGSTVSNNRRPSCQPHPKPSKKPPGRRLPQNA